MTKYNVLLWHRNYINLLMNQNRPMDRREVDIAFYRQPWHDNLNRVGAGQAQAFDF